MNSTKIFASLFLSIFFTLNLFGEDGDVDLLKIEPITLKYETVRDNTDKIDIYKISFYLNKENADSELIHVDHIVKSSYLIGSPIRHFHRYFRINDSRIALIFIEKELIITGAKLVILEKNTNVWKNIKSVSLFNDDANTLVMASPRDMESPFTLKLQSKNELLVEYVAREGEVHRVIVKIPEN